MTHASESALFAFDRNPIFFWALGLGLVAGLQYLNLKRSQQTEVI
jgi:hypothetical protein